MSDGQDGETGSVAYSSSDLLAPFYLIHLTYIHTWGKKTKHLSLVQCILIAHPPLDRRSFRDAVDPLEQMREGLHVVLCEARELVALDPGPGADVGDGVLALAVAGQVVARLAGVLAAQLDLEDAVDAEGFVAEAVDCVCVCLGESVSVLWFVMRRRRRRRRGRVWEMQGRVGIRTRDLLLSELGKVVYLPLVSVEMSQLK